MELLKPFTSFGIFSKESRESLISPVPSTSPQDSTAMADLSEFEIPSSILAAAVVAKSELTGKELEIYAVDLQRQFIRHMLSFRKRLEAEEK
jgi:hypothetical protein